MNAPDVRDPNSKREYDAYLELAREHGVIANRLHAMAERMAGYRDLPMGSHDERAMSTPQVVAAFLTFVRLEEELFALLQRKLEQDRKLLVEMRGAGYGAG